MLAITTVDVSLCLATSLLFVSSKSSDGLNRQKKTTSNYVNLNRFLPQTSPPPPLMIWVFLPQKEKTCIIP